MRSSFFEEEDRADDHRPTAGEENRSSAKASVKRSTAELTEKRFICEIINEKVIKAESPLHKGFLFV